MSRIGFGVKRCKWVEVCLRLANMSILVNGSPTEELGLGMVVRQGDPLSLFLFILAAEGLNAIISASVETRIFRGTKCFEEVFGLRVNYNKSKLYGIGVNERELSEMASWMRCGARDFPFTYVGLPIGENMRRINAWNLVVEKFKSWLDDWKTKTMSFGGRLTLVKTIL
nr:protein kinase-like domain, beta-lactamase/transpeptidase-like protein [Tanacetum cinerariifolium]